MAVTIRDVAKAAGVSVSTVSRALNGYTDVKEETRKKIQTTAEFLGYTPNQSASNLASKTKRNIALLISNIGDEEKMDEFSGNILRGLYSYLNENGITMATYGISSGMQEKKSLKDFCDEYSLSGVIFVGMKIQEPYLIQAESLDIPCVCIDTDIKGKRNAVVTSDDVSAFEEIIDYLIDNGHREIILVTGTKSAQVTHMRYAGYRKSIEKHGFFVEEKHIMECQFLEEEAYRQIKNYIKKNKTNKATAFACMSDIMALGAVRAIYECGYRIPEDFSVTGFDGLYVLNFIKPGITTVDQNVRGKGTQAIITLLKLMDGYKVPQHVYVSHRIIYRESVKKLCI